MPCDITAASMSPSIRSVYRSARSSARAVEVARHDVGTEEGDRKFHRCQRAGLLQQFEAAQLLADRQAVSRLHLERRDAAGHDPLQRRREPAEQLVVAGIAGGHHARPDTAATSGDLGQRCAAETLGVLVAAFAGEQRMAVALDEARKHATTARIDRRHRGIAVRRQHLVRGAHRDDDTVSNRDRAIGDDVELALASPPRRGSPRSVTRASDAA